MIGMRSCAVALALGAFVATTGRAGAASDGTIFAAYGTRPTLHCKPLYLSDLVLEAGERITTLAVGDSARWRLGKGVSGAHGEIEHVFIKPTEFATDTNLEILTDRRVYNVVLVNDARSYTPRIAFYAPQQARQASYVRERAVPPPVSIVSAAPVAPTSPRIAVRPVVARPPVAAAPPRAQPAPRAPGEPAAAFARDYATAGPITVSHDAKRTYISIEGDLRRTPVLFSADLNGTHVVAARRSGNTYVVPGVASELSIWTGGVQRAYAVRTVADVATATPTFEPPAGRGRRMRRIRDERPIARPETAPPAPPADRGPAPATLDTGG